MTDALRPRARLGVGRAIDGEPASPRDRAGERARGERNAPTARMPARQRATALNRERHQADYAILVIVVALTAVGILMV